MLELFVLFSFGGGRPKALSSGLYTNIVRSAQGLKADFRDSNGEEAASLAEMVMLRGFAGFIQQEGRLAARLAARGTGMVFPKQVGLYRVA